MAKENTKYYLGEHGKIFGPYDNDEINALVKSGEILRYSYLWSPGQTTWQLITKAPPSPLEAGVAYSRKLTFEAICSTPSKVMVSGSIVNLSDSGCELISRDSSGSPKLGLRSSVVMNIMDPQTRKSLNVKVKMRGAEIREGRWVYQVRWNLPFDLEALTTLEGKRAA
jgi:hypothetical protein